MATCNKCGTKSGFFSPALNLVGENFLCAKCEAEQIAAYKIKQEDIENNYRAVLIISSFDVQGKKITKYFDFISSEHVIGTGFLAENLSDISDLFGTTSGAYQDKFKKIKEYAVKSIKCTAYSVGANAVIGVDIKYTVTAGKNLIIVSLCGTPVVIE